MEGILTSTHVTTIIWLTFIVIVLRSLGPIILGVLDVVHARAVVDARAAAPIDHDSYDADLIDEDPDDGDDQPHVNGHEHPRA